VKQELKHVNYYRLSLLKGRYAALEATGHHTLAFSGTAAGYYITPVFDTGEDGCTYNRLVVDGRFEGAKLEMIAAATDETEVLIDGKPQELKSWLYDAQVPAHKKAEVLTALPHVRMVNTQDLLLHGLRGRYIWLYAALLPLGGCDCELSGLRLELPKYSFTEYFPEIYQGNDFFERYIAIFQSLFLDAERMVDNLPRLLDYRTAPDGQLEELAGWLGIDNSRGLFSPSQLRHLIENIDTYQGAKGTKHALERMLLLITGIRPRIVEVFEWLRLGLPEPQLAVNKRLYGDTANHFCVILDLTKTKLKISEDDLEQIIGSFSVLGSQFRIVCLKPCSHTDTHCYLGINSIISVPEVAGLDSGAFGGHIIIG
jgi:phage tail-like protein